MYAALCNTIFKDMKFVKASFIEMVTYLNFSGRSVSSYKFRQFQKHHQHNYGCLWGGPQLQLEGREKQGADLEYQEMLHN